MLPTLRKNVRRLSWTLWLVIIAFIALYIPDLVRERQDVVARVDGDPILAEEFRSSLQEQIEYYRSLSEGELPDDFISQFQLDRVVLEQLISRRLLLAAARDQGLSVAPREILDRILEYDVFRGDDGRFIGTERYQEVLRRNSLEMETFEAYLVQDILVERLTNVITTGVSVSDEELEDLFARDEEKVRLDYVAVRPEAFEAEVGQEITANDVVEHFERDPDAYRVPEQRRVTYAVLDTEGIRASLELGEDRLRLYYDNNVDEFTIREQVRARHILFRVPPGGDEAAQADARSRAEDAVARARAGEDFAALARDLSDDTSASAGGDLGWFGHGTMVEEFDAVAFNLADGEISDAVETAFGFHVIKSEGKRDERVQGFEEVRGQIEQRLAWQEAEQRVDELAENVRRDVLRGEGLEEIAETYELDLQTSDLFTQAEGIADLSSATMLERMFSLGEGRVGEPVRTSDGHAVFRVDEIRAPHTPELDEVRERVRGDVVDEQSVTRAAEVATRLAGRLDEGEALEELAVEIGTTVESTELIGRDDVVAQLGRAPGLVLAAFALDAGEGGGPVDVDAAHVLFRVEEHVRPDWAVFATQRETLLQQELAQRRNRLFEAYLTGLREEYRVTVNDSVLERLTS